MSWQLVHVPTIVFWWSASFNPPTPEILQRERVEEFFACGDVFACVPQRIRPRVGQVDPSREEGEGVTVEGRAGRIRAERVIDAWIVGLSGQMERSAGGALGFERPGCIVAQLGAEERQLEIHNGGQLLARRGGVRLGMSKRRIDRLMRQIGHEVCAERAGIVQRRDRFAPIEHHGAQKPQIDRWKRSPIHRQHALARRAVYGVGAAVRVRHRFDAELSVVGDRQLNTDQPVADEEAVRRGVTARHAGTVGPVDVGKERIISPGRRESGRGTGAAQPQRIAHQVARAATTPIRSQRLEERIVRVDRPDSVVGGHVACRVLKPEQVRHRRSGGEDDKCDEGRNREIEMAC